MICSQIWILSLQWNCCTNWLQFCFRTVLKWFFANLNLGAGPKNQRHPANPKPKPRNTFGISPVRFDLQSGTTFQNIHPHMTIAHGNTSSSTHTRSFGLPRRKVPHVNNAHAPQSVARLSARECSPPDKTPPHLHPHMTTADSNLSARGFGPPHRSTSTQTRGTHAALHRSTARS